MKKDNHKIKIWQKRFCAALAISLLIGNIFILPGEAARRLSAKEENSPDVEVVEDIADTGSEIPAPEAGEIKQQEQESLTSLQIPVKLEIVIDPWEIDEKEQIYSEPFVVKNTGNTTGILTLFFTCELNKEEGVEIRENLEELRESEEKLLYVKALFGNEEEAVFTEDGAECQAKLQPGEELSLWFEGEVNENAGESWKSGDIEIKGIYSWELEETALEAAKESNEESEKERPAQEEIQPAESDEKISDDENVPIAGTEEKTDEENGSGEVKEIDG